MSSSLSASAARSDSVRYSGKSTQVPSFILEHGMAQGKPIKIYCTEVCISLLPSYPPTDSLIDSLVESQPSPLLNEYRPNWEKRRELAEVDRPTSVTRFDWIRECRRAARSSTLLLSVFILATRRHWLIGFNFSGNRSANVGRNGLACRCYSSDHRRSARAQYRLGFLAHRAEGNS